MPGIPAIIDLTNLASKGFAIQGDATGDRLNSERRTRGHQRRRIDDPIVGASFGDDGDADAARPKVVFGSSAPSARLNLPPPAAQGFKRFRATWRAIVRAGASLLGGRRQRRRRRRFDRRSGPGRRWRLRCRRGLCHLRLARPLQHDRSFHPHRRSGLHHPGRSGRPRGPQRRERGRRQRRRHRRPHRRCAIERRRRHRCRRSLCHLRIASRLRHDRPNHAHLRAGVQDPGRPGGRLCGLERLGGGRRQRRRPRRHHRRRALRRRRRPQCR